MNRTYRLRLSGQYFITFCICHCYDIAVRNNCCCCFYACNRLISNLISKVQGRRKCAWHFKLSLFLNRKLFTHTVFKIYQIWVLPSLRQIKHFCKTFYFSFHFINWDSKKRFQRSILGLKRSKNSEFLPLWQINSK